MEKRDIGKLKQQKWSDESGIVVLWLQVPPVMIYKNHLPTFCFIAACPKTSCHIHSAIRGSNLHGEEVTCHCSFYHIDNHTHTPAHADSESTIIIAEYLMGVS